ncbi:metallophosphoesterase [Ideonella livida]|uniref:Phosphoesterase n=1 Tax=Ideonella livida TaxID=2707176 RepID=A0A7C9TMW5_9BURK|nr:metallophosphoesterase [Ideonella livida]NDY92945.1 phosphoesterase [Ideonella livida]
MRLQILSDLHLESEDFSPEPAPGAEALVLAGDIDTGWTSYARFAGWPVPVLVVAGNHEFDRREIGAAWRDLRALCDRLGLRLLERESVVMTGDDGRPVRLTGVLRWSDFDLFGAAQRERALRAAAYFQRVQQSTVADGTTERPFDALAVREAGLADRAWLESALAVPLAQAGAVAQVVITHFAPSLRSADPRYGRQPGTASFCNADDDLLARADLWIHGHVHCRHDYRVERTGRLPARVVCNARGLARKGEADGFDGFRVVEV